MRRNMYFLAVALLLTLTVEAIAQPPSRTIGSRRINLDDNTGRSINIENFDRTIAIGASGTNALPNSAIFFVDGTGGSGVLPSLTSPRGVLLAPMSTAQRNAILAPANGLLIYNTTTNEYEYFNGSS